MEKIIFIKSYKCFAKKSMSVSLLVLFLFLFSVSTKASTFTIPDWIINSAVFVMNGDRPFGSGFLLGLREDGVTYCYLITAKHVIVPLLSEGRKLLTLRFNHKNNQDPIIMTFSTDSYNDKQWLEHENQSVDIAIVPIPIYDKQTGDISPKDLNVNMYIIDNPTSDYLATKEWINKYNIARGDKVFTIGLVPSLYSKNERNLVLSRFGNISLLSQKELDLPRGKQKVYFVDCPSFGGNSGGPVYVLLERTEASEPVLGWKIALLGVVIEFVESPLRMEEVELQEKEREKGLKLLENTGISKVVPVDYIVDILFSDSLKASRKQATQTIKKNIKNEVQQKN